ncbi:MAG: hypothetical protein EOP53_03755 [Sphingobacteriales bacterium]|nr:MAG: hypothetical protein EOP53_03755 [Sphingobacteriales bacterium]
MNYRLLLIFLVGLLINSCKEEKTDDIGKSDLTPVNAEVFPMEIAVLRAEGLQLIPGTYNGKIGDKEVVLNADTTENILTFLVPQLTEGSYKLILSIDDKEQVVDYKVKKAVDIADASGYIQQKLDQVLPEDSSLANTQKLFAGVEGNEYSADNLTILKNYRDYVNQTIAALSEEDKKTLALFMAANPILFAGEEDARSYIDSFSLGKNSSETPEEILDEGFKRIESSKNKLYVILGITAVAAYTGQPWLAAVAGLAGIYKIYQLNNSNIAMLDKALVRFGEMLADDIGVKKKTVFYKFEAEKTYVIKPQSEYRNPNKTDLSTDSRILKGIINTLNITEKTWKKINAFTSKFGYQLKGAPFHIKNVSKIKSKKYYIATEYLKFENFNGEEVTPAYKVSDNGLEIEFTTTNPNVNHNIYFEIAYKSEFGESFLSVVGTLDLSANVIEEIKRVINLGNWKVKQVTGASFTDWPNTQEVTVKYIYYECDNNTYKCPGKDKRGKQDFERSINMVDEKVRLTQYYYQYMAYFENTDCKWSEGLSKDADGNPIKYTSSFNWDFSKFSLNDNSITDRKTVKNGFSSVGDIVNKIKFIEFTDNKLVIQMEEIIDDEDKYFYGSNGYFAPFYKTTTCNVNGKPSSIYGWSQYLDSYRSTWVWER